MFEFIDMGGDVLLKVVVVVDICGCNLFDDFFGVVCVLWLWGLFCVLFFDVLDDVFVCCFELV